MFRGPLPERSWSFLVATLLVACATTSSSEKSLCSTTPDESTMLQVIKPVARTVFVCVDEVLLAYKIRGEFASAVLQLFCQQYYNCVGKFMGKKATKEGRNESLHCMIQYMEQNLACFMRRLDLPWENEKKANAVIHWFYEIVRP
ncbi:uncharacterized protein [Dermacentor andersoni]|uniref:uncharacterized protein isoform X2 n=1 Tax=Dermacentor andersoni TaxID=34620 RepID=UPI003B3B3CCF